jgi:hypothetical protein
VPWLSCSLDQTNRPDIYRYLVRYPMLCHHLRTAPLHSKMSPQKSLSTSISTAAHSVKHGTLPAMILATSSGVLTGKPAACQSSCIFLVNLVSVYHGQMALIRIEFSIKVLSHADQYDNKTTVELEEPSTNIRSAVRKGKEKWATYGRNERTSPSTPCFVAEYTSIPGDSIKPATDETSVIDRSMALSAPLPTSRPCRKYTLAIRVK